MSDDHRKIEAFASHLDAKLGQMGNANRLVWEIGAPIFRTSIVFAGNGGASIDTLKNSVEDIRERSQDVATEDGLTMNSDIGLRGKDAVHLVMQVAPDAYLKTLKKSDTIDVYYIDLEKFFRGELSRRRKRDELPFPDLPANHEKNRSKPRLTTAFGSRVDPDLAEKVDQLIEDRGITKREAFEEAFADLLQKYHR